MTESMGTLTGRVLRYFTTLPSLAIVQVADIAQATGLDYVRVRRIVNDLRRRNETLRGEIEVVVSGETWRWRPSASNVTARHDTVPTVDVARVVDPSSSGRDRFRDATRVRTADDGDDYADDELVGSDPARDHGVGGVFVVFGRLGDEYLLRSTNESDTTLLRARRFQLDPWECDL